MPNNEKRKLFNFFPKKLSADLEKKDKRNILIFKYTTSLILFVVAGALLVWMQDESPIEAVKGIWKGSFGSLTAFGNTLRWAAPSILTGAAAIVAFKAGVNNLGIEGQVAIGGFVAGILGVFFEFPPVVHILFILICATLSGLLWSVIPAILRLFFKVDEFITTMMMNYVANYLTQYLVQQVLAGGLDNWGYVNMASTPTINGSAYLPDFIPDTTATLAVPVAFLISFAIAFLYRYTVEGYELKQVGENLKFAKAGGVKVVQQYLIIFLLSGAIAGLCGGIEVLGTYHKFNNGFAANMGWEGISIARIAELNPVGLIFVGFIWGVLKAGSMQMERMVGVNRLTVQIVEYMFVLFISIDYEGIYMRHKDRKNKKAYLESHKEASNNA
ncbi:MAG: ABC transporter permease [Erysipelotrichaceae bacterium]|nr:ABC transporter permease [Erysipelotrichaceae bacterium]